MKNLKNPLIEGSSFMYAELVVKWFNIGVTNADVRWPLSVFLSSTKNIISFASEKRDSVVTVLRKIKECRFTKQ
jgi:hypothetical protein